MNRVRVRLKAAVLLGSVLIVALLTPHLVRGHLFLSDGLSQSAVLLVDFVLAFAFVGIYYRDLEKLRKQTVTVETRLSDSFRYIGKSNVTVELFADFMRPPEMRWGRAAQRQYLLGLLQKILVSVLKSASGLIRFVDVESLRTITEFPYSTTPNAKAMVLPNILVREDSEEGASPLGDCRVLRSLLPHQRLGCLLVYVPSGEDGDDRLALLLLHQFHLLYLVYRAAPARTLDIDRTQGGLLCKTGTWS